MAIMKAPPMSLTYLPMNCLSRASSIRPGGIGGLATVGPLDEMDENTAGGARVQERDLRSASAWTRRLVDHVKPRGAGVAHRLFDVGDAERDVVQALATPGDELRDVALVDHLLVTVGHAVLEDLEVGVPDAGEGRAQASVRVLFLDVVDLEPELVAEDLEVLAQVSRGDADMVDAQDAHGYPSGCRGFSRSSAATSRPNPMNCPVTMPSSMISASVKSARSPAKKASSSLRWFWAMRVAKRRAAVSRGVKSPASKSASAATISSVMPCRTAGAALEDFQVAQSLSAAIFSRTSSLSFASSRPCSRSGA